jgi:hypothetical protein
MIQRLIKAFLLPYLKNFAASPEKKFFQVWRQKLSRGALFQPFFFR